MTELLTESFCERCGNRYELGTAEPMTRKQKTRGMVTGLRQFIMSQDSLSDSINDAMRVEEEQLAARQIDAFQEAFNFCFDCRRYTCVSCWNDDAGRCRSCMPVAGIDDVAGFDERMAGPVLMPAAVDETPLLTLGDEPAWPAEEGVTPPLAWPSEDDVVAPIAAETPAASEPAEEPIAAAAEADLVVPEMPEPVAEPEFVPGFAAPEPEFVPGFAAAEPEISLAAEADEAAVEPIEEPITAAAEEVEPEPAAPALPPPAAPRRDLRDTFARGPIVARPPTSEPAPESLAARRSQLDILGIDDPGEGTVAVGQQVALPYRSSGAGSAANSAALAAVWDASTRYLEAGSQRAAIRPCAGCGLTVSTTARFCRRCGAPQTLSA